MRDPTADVGTVLVCRPEVQAEQQAGLDDLVQHVIRAAIEALLAADDIRAGIAT
jgi:hypothetical protein